MSSERQPINAMFEMQRHAIQQSQQLLQQGLDMQQRMTESMLHNNLDAGHNAQRQGTEFARNWLDTYFRTLGTAFGQVDTSEVSQTLEKQFEHFSDSQEEAWNAFEDSLDQAMTAYKDLGGSQAELIDHSFTSFVEMQRETGERVAAAACPWLARPPERTVAADTGEAAETAQTVATTTTEKAAEVAEQTTDEETEPDTSTDHAVTTDSDESVGPDETSTSTTDSDTLDLQYLSGIGTAYEDRLEAVGITSVEALANADPEELASQTALPETRLREWIEQAKHHVQRS